MKKRKRFHLLRKLKEVIGKIGTLNLILILVGAFRAQGMIPESYACAVVAATIGECGICGWIRTTKYRRREHQWEQEEKLAEKSKDSKEREERTDE